MKRNKFNNVLRFILIGVCLFSFSNNNSTASARQANNLNHAAGFAYKNYDDPDAKLTLKKYDRIKMGMSYKKVVKIIGTKGMETFYSKVGKYKTVSYKWEGENFQFIYATFQNDKLTSKVQANLE